MTHQSRVEVVDYNPSYREAFSSMNYEWISKYFTVEEIDRKSLDNPEGYILNKGGHILVALYDGRPAGVCALLKMDTPELQFELAKMAVSPKFQGKGIGYIIGKAALDKARALGAKKVYLESNTKLTPAINLYRKLGFEKVEGIATPYQRCNIQMEIELI